MPDMPTIHRNTLTYAGLRSPLRRRTRAVDSSGDSLSGVRRKGQERRRLGDRRRQQIKVRFDRRQHPDRRQVSRAQPRRSQQQQQKPAPGQRINTTA